MNEALPNLIIGGAPKCGTSSLHAWLAAHPDALGSTPKETYYFVDPGSHMQDPTRHITSGLTGYRAFFRQRPGRPTPNVIFEATPMYLYSRTALTRLPDLPTAPRFVFILREPSAQIRSLYQYFRDNWSWIPSEMSFADYVTAVRTGSNDFRGNELARNALDFADYRPFLERWRERLGAERIRVYLFEDSIREPRRFMTALSEWLGLDPGFYRDYEFPLENASYAVRWRPAQRLNVAVRSKLPQGPLYRLGRRLYRALNTTPPPPPTHDATELMAQLRAEFAQANACLSASFGLDLSAWEPVGRGEGTARGLG